MFTPVKVGIAGEKYFEVLSGLKDGDEVIIGPPTVARTLRDGDEVKATPAPSPHRRCVASTLMQQFIEAANIALQAIWANKLRSLLTVLGNIVAVTSIIAVVSLVQGLNASVEGRDPVAGRRRHVRGHSQSRHAHATSRPTRPPATRT